MLIDGAPKPKLPTSDLYDDFIQVPNIVWTGLPTFHAGKVQDVATARHAISTGLLDMVGMTRAHMADPNIIRKLKQGHEHDVSPCVGANYCLDRIYEGGESLCLRNAATGRELSMPDFAAASKTPNKIVVVGVGPAGLEAAQVASEKGMPWRYLKQQISRAVKYG